MPILIGAIAYRALQSDEVEEPIRAWQMTGDHDGRAGSEHVLCPKCNVPYILVEGIDSTREIMQDNMGFLAKAISAGHPLHPARMVIRDRDGGLYKQFNI